MSVPGANRGWRVIHQSLVIWNLNMRNKSLMAFVDFRIKTTNPNLKGKVEITHENFVIFKASCRSLGKKSLVINLKGIKLNARQLKIYSVRVKDENCKFHYIDPASRLAKEDSKKSHDHISHAYDQALSVTDPDKNNGELSIEFPEKIKQLINCPDPPELPVTVEYTLDKDCYKRGNLDELHFRWFKILHYR